MKTKCPYCSCIATEHETLDEQKNPRDEDISFCINCGEVSQYLGKELIKVDINTLDEPTQRMIKEIEYEWIKTRKIFKMKGEEIKK